MLSVLQVVTPTIYSTDSNAYNQYDMDKLLSPHARKDTILHMVGYVRPTDLTV